MEAGFLWSKNKGHEWDLNDWRWDANLFLATPSRADAAPSGSGRAQGELDFGVVDKRRRVSPEDGGAECSDAAVTNGESHGVVVQRGRSSEEEERPPRKGAAGPGSPPSCQVDGCQADLSGARDYHRRHKVCEAHTRSNVARIRSVEHRFCQQCSRSHLGQEFDEGKKSCRSRLAKHNVRRRKVQPQAGVDGNSIIENQPLSNTLFLLLKQLSGLESGSSSEQINHPNYLVNLLKNLSAIAGTQAYQDMLKNANSASISPNAGNYVANGFTVHEQTRRPVHVGTELSAEEPPVAK